MTLYTLFVAAGILIYTGTAFIATMRAPLAPLAAFTAKSPVVVPSAPALAQAADQTQVEELVCPQPDGGSQ